MGLGVVEGSDARFGRGTTYGNGNGNGNPNGNGYRYGYRVVFNSIGNGRAAACSHP
jgi:hypothetical protein